MSTVGSLGLADAVTYYASRHPGLSRAVLKRATAALVVVGALATVLMFAVSGRLAGGDEVLSAQLRVAALAIIPNTLTVGLRSTAAGLTRWDLVNRERLVTAVARTLPLLLLWVTGHLSLSAAVAVIAFSPLAGALVYALPHVPPATVDFPDKLTRALARYASRSWLGSLSGILLMRLDQVLMIPLAGRVQLGLYAVAVNISDMLLIVNNAVRDVSFAEEAAGVRDARLQQSARITLLVSGVAGLCLAVPAVIYLPRVFGSGFESALTAVWILIAATVAGVPGSIAGAGLSAIGRPGLRSAALAVAAVVNCLLLVALVPSQGAVGAALATLVGNAVAANANIINYVRLRHVSFLDFYLVRAADVREVISMATRGRW